MNYFPSDSRCCNKDVFRGAGACSSDGLKDLPESLYKNPISDPCANAPSLAEVVSPRGVRLGLVTTWLPVVTKLGNDRGDNFGKDSELQKSLEDGLGVVVETFPIVDQEMIFKIWIGVSNVKRCGQISARLLMLGVGSFGRHSKKQIWTL
jgi:hypothetical protein